MSPKQIEITKYTARELLEMSNQTRQMLKDIASQVEENNKSVVRELTVRAAMRKADKIRPGLKTICETMIAEFEADVAFLTSIVGDDILFISANVLSNGEVGPLGSDSGLACNSLCQYVVATDGPLVVADYNEIPWVFDVPGTKELGAVSYMGSPWHYDNVSIGTLCVLDKRPRFWSSEDQKRIREYAALVTEAVAKVPEPNKTV